MFDESLTRRRFSMTLIAVFAAAGFALAMVGLYGVVALSVSNRRREIGVRMTLGAQTSDVMRMILGEGLWMAVAGIAAGLVGAYLASRLLASLPYGISSTNAEVYWSRQRSS